MAMLVTEGSVSRCAMSPPLIGCSRKTEQTSTADPDPARPMKMRSTAGGTVLFRSRTAMATPHPAVASSNAREIRLRISEIDMRRAFLLQLILNFSIYK